MELVSLKFARAIAVSAGQRECDGEGDDETGEYAELPENWLKVAALAQDALSLCGHDQHAANDGNEADDQERLKDELCSRQREPQRIEQLRDDEDEEYAIKNQERCVDAALMNPLSNEPNGIGTDQGDRNDQHASKRDIKGDLKAVQYATGATNNTG